MDNLIKRIENSEKNNPLLTAALEEIKKLQNQIQEVKNVFFGTDFKEIDDYGIESELSEKEQEVVKNNILTNMLS